MSNIVLLGDSIFDNASYVPGEPAVIDQVRSRIRENDSATLLAIDGDVVSGVSRQLTRLPDNATHLFVSVGGNDALGYRHILSQMDPTLPQQLADAHVSFRMAYRLMLSEVVARGLPATFCTIYDAVPGLEGEAVMALSIFNDTILRLAFEAGVPVIDLRLVCSEAEDYAPISPIEPSSLGGRKNRRRDYPCTQRT